MNALEPYLIDRESKYDPQASLLTAIGSDVGYHSKIKAGVITHPTRESLHYAMVLLHAGGDDRIARAISIIRKILALQDTDPFSPTYGIWSWYAEEPLNEMAPPDWNWADFLGARLAQILLKYANLLPEDVQTGARAALGHAAWSIFRRNVHLEYTNIAVMGGGVSAVAGEILGEQKLLEFGRERLRRVIQLVEFHGSFTEYNSPTYTMVVLEESERMLYLLHDTQARQWAESLRRTAWRSIAEQFHPGTQQWSGPQARAYSNHISAGLCRYFSAQTGVPIEPHPQAGAAAQVPAPSLIPPLPCPPELCGRFAELPQSPTELRRRFIRRESPNGKSPRADGTNPAKLGKHPTRHRYGDRIGTSWFTRQAALCSINHEDLWTQRRGLMGYWNTPQDSAVCLRLRFLHDGKDFASAFQRNIQSGPRVLSAVTFLLDRGDWHPHFDHPADDLFQAEDFRLRYELSGTGARVEQLANDRFALIAGDHQAILHTAPGTFGPHAIRWEPGQQPGQVWVDAICYHGDRKGFNMNALSPTVIISAVELLASGDTPQLESVNISMTNEQSYQASWAGLKLSVPTTADNYPA